MSKFIISFGANAMDHLPEEEMPAVARAAHAVVQEIIDADVYVLAGGLEDWASVVTTEGTVTNSADLGALAAITIIDVPSRDEALAWAARFSAACRCAQEVREVGYDPDVEAMTRR